MPVSCDHLDRFLRAVHRRWMMVRVVESIGLAAGGGCGLTLLLLPILLWRGQPAMVVVLAMLALAAAAGGVAGIVRRPGLLWAAAEADRQLDLDDLLSTAWTARGGSPADDWMASVIATADARCRTLAPNAVVLNRLGARAWGTIGLANAFVLTLGLMSASPRSNEALAASGAMGDSTGELHIPSKNSDVGVMRSHSPQRQHQSPPGRALSERDEEPGEPEVDADAGGAMNAVSESSAPSRADPVAAGSGVGLATSPQLSKAAPLRVGSSPNPTPINRSDDLDGQSAGGGKSSAARDSDDDATGDPIVVAPPPNAPVPAWRGSAWPAAREEALSAVRDRRVPDRYRDLVRDYFENRE